MKLSFTSVQLLGFSRDSNGGRANFSSAMSNPIMKALSWIEMPNCLIGGKLEGELAATVIELEPKEKELAKHRTSLDVQRIGKFNTVRLELESSRGKGHRTELRFTVSFPDPEGCAKLERYFLTCGKSTLTVSYEKAAQQEEIPLATDEQKQAVMEMEG